MTLHMNIITVDVYQGQFKVETAQVQLDGEKIVDVVLSSGKYRPLNAALVESTRQFWKGEYDRLGWKFDENERISRAIGTHLWHVDDIADVSEDAWLDSTYEDRFAGVEYFE